MPDGNTSHQPTNISEYDKRNNGAWLYSFGAAMVRSDILSASSYSFILSYLIIIMGPRFRFQLFVIAIKEVLPCGFWNE